MFKKLDKMLSRYEKLNELVSDAEVIAKIDEWKAYTKELAEISETVEKYTEYKNIKKAFYRKQNFKRKTKQYCCAFLQGRCFVG